MKFDEFTTLTNYNLEILWSTADPEIAEVDANGMIRGLQAGKTTLTAVLKPKSPEIELEEKGNGREGNNMLTLTSDAFLTASIEIDVQQGEPGSEITPTPEPTDTPDQGDGGSGSGGGSSNKPGSGDNADTDVYKRQTPARWLRPGQKNRPKKKRWRRLFWMLPGNIRKEMCIRDRLCFMRCMVFAGKPNL